MIATLLADALATLKQVAQELNTSVDSLTPAQLEKHYQDCFHSRLTNERLSNKNQQSESERVS